MSRVAVSHKLSRNKNRANELLIDIREQLSGEEPKMILVYANTEQDLQEALSNLKKEFPSATVVGCMVPSKFSANDESIEGISCFALAGDYKVHAGMGSNLANDTTTAIDCALKSLPDNMPGYPYVTGFIFYDVFSGLGEEIVMIISSILGSSVSLVGGAAAGS